MPSATAPHGRPAKPPYELNESEQKNRTLENQPCRGLGNPIETFRRLTETIEAVALHCHC